MILELAQLKILENLVQSSEPTLVPELNLLFVLFPAGNQLFWLRTHLFLVEVLRTVQKLALKRWWKRPT